MVMGTSLAVDIVSSPFKISSVRNAEDVAILNCLVTTAVTQGIGIGAAASTLATVASKVNAFKVVGGAIGTAAAVGCISGAMKCGGEADGVVLGTVVAMTAAFGVSALGISMSEISDSGASFGNVGGLLLGAQEKHSLSKQDDKHISFDCWKPILHDDSPDPSTGMLLRDVFADTRILKVDISKSASLPFPNICLTNIWNEMFRIEYVLLPGGQLAAHAFPV